MAKQLLVFISYSRKNITFANQVTDVLEQGGHRPWIDNQLVPGQRWKENIQQAIRDCNAFLLLLSPSSLASEYCRWEYAVALEEKKPIFPVLVKSFGETYPDDMADLANIQYVDMSMGITPANTASLIGGVFQARPLSTQTMKAAKDKEPMHPRGDASLNAFPTDNTGSATPAPLDGTEPLTRLPLPNQNPLPDGISADLWIIKSPTLAQQKFPMHSTNFTVGRAPTMSLSIPEKRISKHHLTIYWANSRFFLVDYSLNGTWLNGERIQNNQPQALDADFEHRFDLARNNTVINFRYSKTDTM